MNAEAIVFIARKLHWTREEIGKLSPLQFNEILKELYYQESVDEWRNQYSLASLLAAIYNTIPRKRGSRGCKATDFLQGGMPQRIPDKPLKKMAEDKGIKLPKE